MSSQLPASANPAHIFVRLRRPIRRRSLVRRQYFDPQTPPLSYSYSTLRFSDQLSNYEKNRNLSSVIFQSSLRSRSVKYSSKLLVNRLLVGVNRHSRSRSVKYSSKVLISNPTSWSRSVKRSSAELVDPPFGSICVQSLSVNFQFIAFNWSFRSRSVEITSTALVSHPRAYVEENNQTSFWILCALTATVCCVSTGFADKSKRHEAPNVTLTEISPVILITVQSSPAKDRIGNAKPSDRQRSPGGLKRSSAFFIRSLDCGKYLDTFISGRMVRLSLKLITDEINEFNLEAKEKVEFLRIDVPVANLNCSYRLAISAEEVACDSENVSLGSGSFLTRSLVMVFVYECYTYPTYECFKAVELNKPDIQQLQLIEMQMLYVVFHFVARFEFDRDDRKIMFNMINNLTRVEKAKNVVIQSQISPSNTDIEQSIAVSDYTQMDRISSGQECGNTLSTLSFGTDVRGKKAGENWFADVHDLMLLCNWHLRWRFVNAKTDGDYFKLTETAECSLYNAQLATSKLLHSVKSKQSFEYNGGGCMCKEKNSMVLELIQVLQEDRTTLIKLCSGAKGNATDGEKEDLVELEEQLLCVSVEFIDVWEHVSEKIWIEAFCKSCWKWMHVNIEANVLRLFFRSAVGHMKEYGLSEELSQLLKFMESRLQLWFLDTSIEEQQRFDNVICLISSSVDEVLSQGSLANEVIELTEVEVEFLNALKCSKLSSFSLLLPLSAQYLKEKSLFFELAMSMLEHSDEIDSSAESVTTSTCIG